MGKQHLRNLRSIHDQHRLHVQAVQDQHDEQLQAIEENGRLSPTKFTQVQEELRRVELLDHNKKVKALEKKNTEQEKKHVRVLLMMDRVVDSQENLLRHQKFEMGEQDRKHSQEMKEMDVKQVKELKEMDVKQVKELEEMDVKQLKELKELRDIGIETAERVKVEHDAKVHKLEEENKVLKSQVERFKADSEETFV